MISEINRRFKIFLSVPDIFQNVNIERLAKVIEERSSANKRLPAVIQLREGGIEPPIYFIYAGPAEFALAQKKATGQSVFAIQVPMPSAWRDAAANFNGSTLPSMAQLVAPYVAALRSHAGSSCCVLAGYSFGGIMAFETARQLLEQDHIVDAVLLFDTWAIPAEQIAWSKLWRDWKLALDALSPDGSSQALACRLKNSLFLMKEVLRHKKRRLGGERAPFPNHAEEGELTHIVDEKGAPWRWPLVDQIYSAARKNYSLSRFCCRGFLFRANPEHYVHRIAHARDGSLGWEPLFAGGLAIIPVTGGHSSIIRDHSHALTLARELNRVLTQLCHSAAKA